LFLTLYKRKKNLLGNRIKIKGKKDNKGGGEGGEGEGRGKEMTERGKGEEDLWVCGKGILDKDLNCCKFITERSNL